ncbi:MAG: tyrosine-type recombinase/integrase [Chloroflexi bacterium]|nr:tyrosine-type recombinase/integrase [Chloroflexota bacterium]
MATALRAHRARQAEARRLAGVRWREQGLVFPTTIGTPWAARNLTRDFDRLLARQGLPDLRWHDLRHSAGSLLYEQGVDLPTIMVILGHAQISMTANRYLHLGAAARQRAAVAMDRVLAPPADAADANGYKHGYRRGHRTRKKGVGPAGFEPATSEL